MIVPFAICANVGLLFYLKYLSVSISFINSYFGTHLAIPSILAPLGISFYTFTQIAYLIDLQSGKEARRDFWEYVLFVVFFPHLLAGPLYHHNEIIPQFKENFFGKFSSQNIAVGGTIFIMGLFKKVVFADTISLYANPIFEHAAKGVSITFVEAWVGILSYALQLYFDFSGYSDMAIGLGRLFGIRLPLNFDSPYKAPNIIQFWHRWHMTLTRFLTGYIYNPIALSLYRRFTKLSIVKKYSWLLISLPMILTMFISGLWHGAGLQYILFGLLHGFYITINHLWHDLKKKLSLPTNRFVTFRHGIGILITFFAVILSFVLFRAKNLQTATLIYHALLLPRGLESYSSSFWNFPIMGTLGVEQGIVGIIFLLTVVWFLPNTQEIMNQYKPSIPLYEEKKVRMNAKITWSPSTTHALLIGFAIFTSFVLLSRASEFIYFNF